MYTCKVVIIRGSPCLSPRLVEDWAVLLAGSVGVVGACVAGTGRDTHHLVFLGRAVSAVEGNGELL